MNLVNIRGRGAAENPRNRFEHLHVELEPEEEADPDRRREQHYYRDHTRTIVTRNDSPDVGFEFSLNPYRGCSHGCIYCYARPSHEYLGWSAGLDFESRIVVKENAAALLRQKLSSPRWTPAPLAMSGITDPYQPAERHFRITRGCLEVLCEARHPVSIITKNQLVVRDIDLLAELARHDAVRVHLSITSLDRSLQRVMEPRTATPERRLETLRLLSKAGIPTGVMVAPVIPGLTDHELPGILERVAEAGGSSAGYIPLRLPHGVSSLFEAWLERHFPNRKERVLNRMREMRGGRLNDPRFGARMRGEGVYADHLCTLFGAARRRAGLDRPREPLSTAAFIRPSSGGQLSFL